MEPLQNYVSVDEFQSQVSEELERLRGLGYAKVFPDWRSLQEHHKGVIVSQMACIHSVRADGLEKYRLVVDLRRSSANSLVKLSERVVLPRLADASEDALLLLRSRGEGFPSRHFPDENRQGLHFFCPA